MANDPRRLAGVAWLVIVAHGIALGSALGIALGIGCGPTIRPDRPPPEPGPVAKIQPLHTTKVSGRQIVVGEMCPQGAGGRPAVAPLVMRTMGWSDDVAEVTNAVERGSVPRFVVFGVDGKIAGRFDTLGLAEIGSQQAVATGTYVGASPCTSDAGGGQRVEDPKCGPATGGCGLAVGELTRPDDPPETVGVITGGACLQGDALAVDIDGDKVMEQFPLVGVLDGVRSPAAEWGAAPVIGAACTPKFQIYDVKIAPHLEPGKGGAEKHIIGFDLLGVADLDGNGRMELVIALEFPTVRTIVVYTTTGSAQRLELAGEGQSFTR
ncbi:MAG: hypothetical protein H0T89_20795 [Deltaproteobacteria bacterium]|nr:hypothetical protein [Deltaproteobacteria bacterium]MDQ3301088.1 hypothetical protein [Myxococcota bacterium]